MFIQPYLYNTSRCTPGQVGGRVGISLMRRHGNQRKVAFLKYPDARVQPLRLEKYEVNIVFLMQLYFQRKQSLKVRLNKCALKCDQNPCVTRKWV